MSNILRVGNLAPSITEPRLAEVCAEFGQVMEAKIASSPLSGKSRGFGFIMMGSESDAAACVAGLQDKECDGQKLTAVLAPADQFKKTKRKK